MRSRRIALALCVAHLAATILVPCAVAVTDARADGEPISPPGDATTSVAAPTSITAPVAYAATRQTNATVTLDPSIATVRGGEATTLELAFQGTAEATVVVGGDGSGDNVTATVTDSNDDGVVPIEFNSGTIGTMATRVYPVDDGDDYATVNSSEYGYDLPAGEYPVSVYVGHGVSGEPADVGTLVVDAMTTPGTATEDATPEPTIEPTTTALPDAFVDHSGDAVTLHPRSEQVVAGSTSLDAGRTVTVRFRSSGGSPFLKSAQAAVGDDGGFAVSFDLRDVEAPANATAVVTVDGDRIAGPVAVEVVAEQPVTTARETPEPGTSSPGQAGFGVGVAVVAAFVVAALVGRRRNRR